MFGLNQDTAINRLLTAGVITRTGRRGYYFVADGGDVAWTRLAVVQRFLKEIVEGSGRYELRLSEIQRAKWEGSLTLRTLRRQSYHAGERDYNSAIELVPYDSDGVRRTFGLEYEIYSLNERQEDKLVRLLEALPERIKYVTERDGSLGTNGVEIVFMPLSEKDYIETVKKLNHFVREQGVTMESGRGSMAGMHTTYGVSNAEASKQDLQIRINRFALAVKAVALQSKIIEVFGRDFGEYRELPTRTNSMSHSNAFSCNGRPRTCWECRLPSWQANPEKLVEFFKITEVAFHRPIKAEDFLEVFKIFGEAE